MSEVALDSWSSYISLQAGEILPDPLFTTLQSPLTMLHAPQGSGCNPLPAAQTSPDPFRSLVRALVRRPGDYEPIDYLHIYLLVCLFVYVFVCVFVCVSVSACVSLTSYACLYVSLCMFICVCLCVSMCLCVCLCHCRWSICLCHYVSKNTSVCVCLCQCTDVEHHLG